MTFIAKKAVAALGPFIFSFFLRFRHGLSSFFILEKVAVLRIKREFSKNVLAIWSDTKKNLLVRLFLMLVQLEIEFFRLFFFLFMHVYYIMFFSTFGRLSSICMLPVIFGLIDRGEGVFLFFLYFSVLSESLLIYLLCYFNSDFEKWMYRSFGKKLVTILCGNHPMNHSLRVVTIFVFYGLARHVDGLLSDERLHKNRDLLLQNRKEHGLPVDEDAFREAHKMAEQRVGNGSLRKLEGAAAASFGEFLKVWSQNKD
jgi:hypothetical protein